MKNVFNCNICNRTECLLKTPFITLLLLGLATLGGCGESSKNVSSEPSTPEPSTPGVQSFMTQYGYVDITCDENNHCTGVYRDSGQPATELLVQQLLEILIVTNQEVIDEALKDCQGKSIGLHAMSKSGMPEEKKYEDWCLPTPDYSEQCGPEGCTTTGGYVCPNSEEIVSVDVAMSYNQQSYLKFQEKQRAQRLETFKQIYREHPEIMSQEEYESRVSFYESQGCYGLSFEMDVCDYPQFIQEFGGYFSQIDLPGNVETKVEYSECQKPLEYEVIAKLQNKANDEYNWNKQTSIPIHSAEDLDNWINTSMLNENAYMWAVYDIDQLKETAAKSDFSKYMWMVLEGGSQPAETFYVQVDYACDHEMIYNVIECLNTGHGAGIGYPFMIVQLPKGEYTFTGGFRQENCIYGGNDGVIVYKP